MLRSGSCPISDYGCPERLPTAHHLTPEEVETLREEMRQAEKRLVILAALSPAVHHLKVGLMAEPDEPDAEGQVVSSRDAVGAAGQPSREKWGFSAPNDGASRHLPGSP
jgi:hypothetical protein